MTPSLESMVIVLRRNRTVLTTLEGLDPNSLLGAAGPLDRDGEFLEGAVHCGERVLSFNADSIARMHGCKMTLWLPEDGVCAWPDRWIPHPVPHGATAKALVREPNSPCSLRFGGLFRGASGQRTDERVAVGRACTGASRGALDPIALQFHRHETLRADIDEAAEGRVQLDTRQIMALADEALDVQLHFSRESVRLGLFRLSAAHRELLEEKRSVSQRLVFGTSDQASPTAFLILDELGGEFRMAGHGSRTSSWRWAPAPDAAQTWHHYGFQRQWLLLAAEIAGRRGRIEIQHHPFESKSIVRPPRYRHYRPSKGYVLGDEQTSETVRAELQSAAVRPPDCWSDELEACACASVVPRSAVRLELPAFPLDGMRYPELAKQWAGLLNDAQLLDLVSSTGMPGYRWCRSVLDLAQPSEQAISLDVCSSVWLWHYYFAAFSSPAATPLEWRSPSGNLLDSGARLDIDFVLGEVARPYAVGPFALS